MGKELMDCREIVELLDAYALGAAEKAEAAGIERHVSDCVRCWEGLNEAQRAAALLALSIPMEQAPETLRERVMAAAAKDRPKATAPAVRPRRLRFSWSGAAGALGLASAAALVFAAFLQVQMSDLRGEKNDLAHQLQDAGTNLAQQQQVLAVLSSPDSQKMPMSPVSTTSSASAVYGWSQAHRVGFIICDGLPRLRPGEVYQAWFVTGGEVRSAGTAWSEDGTCIVAIDLSRIQWRPDGIGITVEPEGGSSRPSEGWLVYASFE